MFLCYYLEKMKLIDILSWNDLSKYRSSLMGIAMMSVFLFHSIEDWAGSLLYGVCKNGDVGVDIFLFLSSIGLGYSFSKNRNMFAFYKRRVLRIFPTYWFVVTCIFVFVATLVNIGMMPPEYLRYPHNLWDVICVYTTIGLWVPNGLFYCWYISAIIFFYLLFPFWYNILEKSRWFLPLCLVPVLIAILFHPQLEMLQNAAYYRIGIFMYGVWFFPFVQSNSKKGIKWWTMAVGIVAFVYYNVREELLINRMADDVLFYAVLPYILLLLTLICRIQKINTLFAFIGGISLEFYLVHEFILRFTLTVSNFYLHVSRGIQVVIAFVVSLLLAYLINKFMKVITNKLYHVF